MKSSIKLQKSIPSLPTRLRCYAKHCGQVLLALGYFALYQTAQAVSPAPDGGYPGANTAEGQSALLGLTTGTYNTAVGWFSLRSNTAGQFNTGVGGGALLANTANENTATGAGALLTNSIGSKNTANGAFALFSNTDGQFNTATGAEALQSNTTGVQNTATGYQALYHNTTINGLFGANNTATGNAALFHNSTGNNNTAIGSFALTVNTVGGQNTAIGEGALQLNTTGTGNTVLGANAGGAIHTASNVICIGTDGNNVDNACYIGQIFTSSLSGTAVVVNSNGRLGATTSSQRFKDNIKPMDQASEGLFALKPVIFRYKKEIDPARTSQFGLVAEEVEKVNPDLIVRDKEGKPYSVRYEQVNAMLLNEFLKEHRKVEKLEATVAQQQKDFQASVAQLTERLDEQAAQVQKVSAQVEAAKPAPQMVCLPAIVRPMPDGGGNNR